MFDTSPNDDNKVERAFLVGINETNFNGNEAEEHLQELSELVDTMGLKVTGSEIVNVRTHNARYYIGSGKVGELVQQAKELNSDCIIVDFDLSPSQQRNWEKESGLCVIDRQEVILDIFADRATTREATIQVALARMEYSLPRLTRAWTHLSRQKGGTKSTRGEGEKQLEADHRIVRKRITTMKKELKEVSKHREVQRTRREKSTVPLGAIVGYTNVGKSSLLNSLSGADVFVENKLFATLDPTTKHVDLPGKQKILLTDTVGFVRKLPHNLVEAFKSTLEEALVADFIIHVLDVSSECVEAHWHTTMELLDELNAINKPIITVYNKIDKLESPVVKARLRALRPDAIFVSVKSGEGIEQLLEKLNRQSNVGTELLHFCLPPENYEVPAGLYKYGKVVSSKYEDERLYISARLPKKYVKDFEKFAT